MSRRTKFKQKPALARTASAQAAIKTAAPYAILPLGAMLLAGSMGAMAQEADSKTKTLAPVVVKEKAEGKDSIRATSTGIGKGNQALRDIPQSITVVTEKLIDDRNLDTLKDVLHNTAGVTFQAAEGGEEDIRLRGFSLFTSATPSATTALSCCAAPRPCCLAGAPPAVPSTRPASRPA